MDTLVILGRISHLVLRDITADLPKSYQCIITLHSIERPINRLCIYQQYKNSMRLNNQHFLGTISMVVFYPLLSLANYWFAKFDGTLAESAQSILFELVILKSAEISPTIGFKDKLRHDMLSSP